MLKNKEMKKIKDLREEHLKLFVEANHHLTNTQLSDVFIKMFGKEYGLTKEDIIKIGKRVCDIRSYKDLPKPENKKGQNTELRVKSSSLPSIKIESKPIDKLKILSEKNNHKEKLLSLLAKDKLTELQLSEKIKEPIDYIKFLMEEIKAERYNLIEDKKSFYLEKDPIVGGAKVIDLSKMKNKTYKFGAVADNHLNSKFERLDVLNAIYDIFEKEGVKIVFNGGNWIDGEARFNKYEILNTGMTKQIDYFIKNYPQRKGIVTQFVAGDDHEGWYWQREGINIGEYTQMKAELAGRKDLQYLGYVEADVELKAAKGSSKLRIMHGGGGTAYALSYTPQKMIESFQGGEKPNILLLGHYHKADYFYYRDVHCIQMGCFTANTKINTDKGRISIKNIKEGDLVTTHKNRLRKVTKTFKHKYDGDFYRINYGRKGRFDQTLTATEEHPIYIEREGKRVFLPIKDVRTDDFVFVEGTHCEVCNEIIPFYHKLCRDCNPCHKPEVRAKIQASRNGAKKRIRGGSGGEQHLINDIIPFCEQKELEGWRMIPVGSGVIPDAVGIKDGKVMLFEIEKSHGTLLDYKKNKYEMQPEIMKFVDGVEWIDAKPTLTQPRSFYEYDKETGLVKVKVISVTNIGKLKGEQATVYNFEVEEDNSYLAGRVAVHNCTQDQTTFMRKKKIQASVGGWIIEFQQSEDGAITRFKAEWISFFNKNYYDRKKYYQ